MGSRFTGVMVAALAAAAMLICAPIATAAPGDGECVVKSKKGGSDPDALEGVCEWLETREGVAQVGLYDSKTGITYKLRNGDDRQVTASIVKVDIMSRWLRRFDNLGYTRFPEDVPFSIQYLLNRMIQNSDNAAATALFSFGGGCDVLTRFNQRIPMPDTKVGCETPNYYGWGNTETTASDQVKLIRMLAYGDPKRVLSPDARAYGRKIMQGVESDQRFGITCGPWGDVCERPDFAPPDPDVTISVKNGWKTLPDCTKPIPQCPWQVNSTGWVNGKGRNYVLSVLTTKNPVGTGDLYGFDYGIASIQGVSKLIWSNLGPAGRR